MFMSESDYLNELEKAKYFQKHSESSDYWMGYILGLHKGHDDNFQCPNEKLLSSDSLKGSGYRDGLSFFLIEKSNKQL